MTGHKVVSEKEWRSARVALLAKEKALTHQRDALARERQELPWVRVEKEYVFQTPEGKRTLGDLFGDKSQLLIYHFMFGPEWEQGCPSCSMATDTMDANYLHVTHGDVAFAMVSRAPMEKIAPFKKRMGWTVPWVSSDRSDFNFDFAVSFTNGDPKESNWYNFGTSNHPSDEAQGVALWQIGHPKYVFLTHTEGNESFPGRTVHYVQFAESQGFRVVNRRVFADSNGRNMVEMFQFAKDSH